jgi:ankyrin repeat protein
MGCKEGYKAVVKLLVEKGADLESKDPEYGRTLLSWAAEIGHEAVVKLLLEKGTELESKDKEYGQTLILWAAAKGHEDIGRMP